MWSESEFEGVRILACNVALADNDMVEQGLYAVEATVFAQPASRWVVDISKIPLVNSEAIALLIRIVRRVNLAGGRIALLKATPFVRGVLQSLRIVRILPIFDDVEQARVHWR